MKQVKAMVRDLIERSKALQQRNISVQNFKEATKLHRDAMSAWDIVERSDRPRYRDKYSQEEIFNQGMQAIQLELQAAERLHGDMDNHMNHTILCKSACFMLLRFGFARDALDLLLIALMKYAPSDLTADLNEIADGIFAQLFPAQDIAPTGIIDNTATPPTDIYKEPEPAPTANDEADADDANQKAESTDASSVTEPAPT